ncbi:hypothetical protein LCGC14_2177230 [marine sediment metagenome]|uniref:PD-(D/E)XK endonuclease-like domain-containing protein n=1 Tax=marine sediment metagenome TaxID=412755 RepID=A0A0F9GJ53_9ZZZZ
MVEALALETIRSTETRQFNGVGCPLEWLYDRVDEAEFIAPQPRSYYERGHLGHAMIGAYLLSGDIALVDDILEGYVPAEGEWKETSKCTKEGLLDEVKAIFDRWVDQYEEFYTEYISVDTEVLLEVETPNGTLVSTEADAIFINEDGRPTIVDWKLGTSKSGHAIQLYVYWYCMRRLGIAKPSDYFRGWFHYVNYAKPIKMVGEYPGDEFVEAYIDNAERNRREGPYLPNPTYFDCRYCDHSANCPLFGDDPVEAWNYIKEVEITFV